MADMLTIATLSANTFKKALEVTSHNVANVATEGYTRQRAVIVSNAPGVAGNSFQGSGSSVQTVERTYSEYYQSQLVVAESLKARYEEQMSLSQQIEGVIASNDDGVQEFMNRFFESLQSLSNNPTSTASRQQVLDEASSLESHVGNLTSVLDEANYQLNNQIYDNVTEINNQVEIVQKLNERIEYAVKTTGQQPNDLMDQRDQAILELSKYIDVKQYESVNGTMDIYTANGKIPLVSGNTITRIVAEPSEYRADNRTEVYIKIGDEKREISSLIQGGELGGIIDYRTNMLDQAKNDLGLTLNGMVASMNWQHYQGYDMNDMPGRDFFQPLEIRGIESGNNEGSIAGSQIVVNFNPNPTAAIQPPYIDDSVSPAVANELPTYGEKQANFDNALDEIGNFKPRDYELIYNENTELFEFFDYNTKEAIRDSSGNTIGIRPGTAANVEGLYFDLSNFPDPTALNAASPEYVDDDSFLIRPHQAMLEQFDKVIEDGQELATRGQSPVLVDINGNPVTDIDDAEPGPAADGDNTNMANMAAMQSRKILLANELGDATETLLGGYSNMASNVGMYVRSTDVQLMAQTNVYDQVWAQRESFSGVSLDEEAANLIKYQQAYQATAQIISTVQSMFQTLLSVAGGR